MPSHLIPLDIIVPTVLASVEPAQVGSVSIILGTETECGGLDIVYESSWSQN